MNRTELKWPELLIGTTAACALDYMLAERTSDHTGPQVAWVQIGLLVLSIALSYLAGKLLAAKKKPKFDDRITTLADRGSYLPRVLGRRRIGPVFAGAWNRESTKEAVAGGKGNVLGVGPKQRVYKEDAWHLLCMGPALQLHAIYDPSIEGGVLFQGPITSTSHPSGSFIDLGHEGGFRIFWGEFDQDINTELGDPSRMGISSRWPGVCYIQWTNKRLGTSAIWPQMEYEIEVRTQSTILTQTPAYTEPTRTLTGNIDDIDATVINFLGEYFEFDGNITAQHLPLQVMRLTGHSSMPDQDVTVVRTQVITHPFPDPGHTTRIFVDVPLIAGTGGTIQNYEDAPDDGLNYAHVLAELLFGTSGYGLAHNQALYDMDSLEALGVLTASEDLLCAIYAPQGVSYQEVISGILIDLGVFISLDYTTGKFKFVPIREPAGTLPYVSGVLQTELPEIQVQHGPLAITNVAYSFKDRQHNYEDTTIGADNDGQVEETLVQKTDIQQIISTVNFKTASAITQRRQQEALAGGAAIVLKTNRSTRQLIPGSAINAEGFDETLRLLSVEADPLSSEVKLQVVTDYYGAPLSSFQQNQGNEQDPAEPTSPDIQLGIVEVPEYLLEGVQRQTLLIPRVRYNSQVKGSDLHISRDDITYTAAGRDQTTMTGGVLIDPMTALDFQRPANSFQFTAKGPDIDSVLDLSADLTSWCNGRQLCVLVDPDTLGYEICFVKKVTAVGGGVYTLDGIIRARYDTPQQTFDAGAHVFILQNDDGVPIQDVLLEPEVTIYVKSQPFGRGGQLPLDEAIAYPLALYGKGLRPITPANIRIDVNLTTWVAGSDFVVRWDYFTPRTLGSGAGLHGAGSASSDQDPEGKFIVEILNASNTVIRQFESHDPSYTYTNADRVADFGGDPTSLKFRLTQLRGGFYSDTITQTFTKV